MINKKAIINILGLLLIIESLFMIVPVLISIIYKEGDLNTNIISCLITLFFGTILYYFTRKANTDLGIREGYIIVTLVWIVFSIFGSLPYYLYHVTDTYTDAFFETISGFTTTGASVISDVESLPHGILFWRSMTHLIGGMGILLLTIAILPIFGLGSVQLYAAESTGPTIDKFHPRVRETAKRLGGIYLSLILAETLILLIGGMSLFDAICHSFGTIATGGFSTKNSSIGGFSPFIQITIIVFMILAGTNFTLYYFILKGKIFKLLQSQEFKLLLIIIISVATGIGFFLHKLNGVGYQQAFRNAFFQVTSIITSTGFSTSDYMRWDEHLWFTIFLLMFLGACAGSTTGGVKLARYLIIFENIKSNFKRMIHPNAIIINKVDGKVLSDDVIKRTFAFIIIYFLTFIIGTYVLLLLGMDLTSSAGAVATTLGGIGPGLGSVGPIGNYLHVPIAGKWVLSGVMLLGRLELFTVLLLFTKVMFTEK